MSKTVDKYVIKVTTEGAKKSEKELSGLGRVTEKVGVSASTAKIAFAALGTALIAGATHAVRTASQFESLRVRLTNMYGSVQAGNKAFLQFQKIASTTPYAVKSVVEAGAQLKAFGMDAEESIKGVADLAAFMGVDVVEAANSMGRAFAGGAGAADVLRERGILNLIKEFKGIDDITQLTLPEFRSALKEAIQDPTLGIAGATDKLSETFEGSYSNMMDSIDMVSAGFGDKLLPMMKSATQIFGNLADDMGLLKSASESQVDALEVQQMHLRLLRGTLNEAEVGSDLYNQTLINLKSTYPDVLKHLNTNKTSLEDINEAIEDNIQLTNVRIKLLEAESRHTAVIETQKEAQKDLYSQQLNVAKGFAQHEDAMSKVYYQLINNIEGTEGSTDTINSLNDSMDAVRIATNKYKEDGDLEAYFNSTKKATQDFKNEIVNLGKNSLTTTDKILAISSGVGTVVKGVADLALSGKGILDIGFNFMEIDNAMDGLEENFTNLQSTTDEYNSTMGFFSGELKRSQDEIDKLTASLSDLEDEQADSTLLPGGDTEANADQIAEIQQQIADHETYKQTIRDKQLEDENTHYLELLALNEQYAENTNQLNATMLSNQDRFDQQMIQKAFNATNQRNQVSFAQIDAQQTYKATMDSYALQQVDLQGQQMINKMLEQKQKQNQLNLDFNLADIQAMRTQFEAVNGINAVEQEILDEMEADAREQYYADKKSYDDTKLDLEKKHGKNMTTLKNLQAEDEKAIDKRATQAKVELAVNTGNELVQAFASNASSLFNMSKKDKKNLIQVEKAVAIALGYKEISGIWSTAPFGPETYPVKLAQSLSAALRTAGNVARMDQAKADIDKSDSNVQSEAKQYSFSGEVAAVGYSGVIDQPTNLLVGEAGQEMVNVTPLDGRENNTGGEVIVNISGNVMSQDFVEGELAEKIQEAVRRGATFGI